MVRASLKVKDRRVYDSNPEETPVPFVAMDAQELGLPKIYLVKL